MITVVEGLKLLNYHRCLLDWDSGQYLHDSSVTVQTTETVVCVHHSGVYPLIFSRLISDHTPIMSSWTNPSESKSSCGSLSLSLVSIWQEWSRRHTERNNETKKQISSYSRTAAPHWVTCTCVWLIRWSLLLNVMMMMISHRVCLAIYNKNDDSKTLFPPEHLLRINNIYISVWALLLVWHA